MSLTHADLGHPSSCHSDDKGETSTMNSTWTQSAESWKFVLALPPARCGLKPVTSDLRSVFLYLLHETRVGLLFHCPPLFWPSPLPGGFPFSAPHHLLRLPSAPGSPLPAPDPFPSEPLLSTMNLCISLAQTSPSGSALLETWRWGPSAEGGDRPSCVFQSIPSSSWIPAQRTC